MLTRSWSLCAVCAFSGTACVFSSEPRPKVDVNLLVASEYLFRGQVMTERPVLQTQTAVQVATADGGTATIAGWGNLDLTDRVGAAWFDRGHGGEFTQTDLWAAYGRSIGAIDASVGLRYYGWPNNARFPFQPFPSTTELFARVGGDLAGFRPAVVVHHDIDEVGSLYVLGEVAREWQLTKAVRLELRASLGWSDERHSRWLYRTRSSALSDLGGSATIVVDLDDVTRLQLAALGSTIVDDDLRSWFDDHIDADNLWLTAGIVWSW